MHTELCFKKKKRRKQNKNTINTIYNCGKDLSKRLYVFCQLRNKRSKLVQYLHFLCSSNLTCNMNKTKIGICVLVTSSISCRVFCSFGTRTLIGTSLKMLNPDLVNKTSKNKYTCSTVFVGFFFAVVVFLPQMNMWNDIYIYMRS